MSVEVVVARYQERVEWTRKVPPSARVTIYDKGGDLGPLRRRFGTPPEIRQLPNLGREAQTYLRHILDCYDSLAPITLFCQGHPFDHASDLHQVLRGVAAGRSTPRMADGSEPIPGGFRWLGFIIDTDDARGRRLFVNWSKNEDRRELRADLFCEALFGAPAPEWLRFYPGGQFLVTAERVRARPREFYERALALSESFPDAAHCFERTWDRIFGVEGVDPALLGGELCRYLKPIRRLGEPGARG
jgi:hypothetical protein